ncbi:hypothetical protein AB1Y20_005565 [Prymnesium parvum]|uniref:Uncharacterized protein n=1 Tax=Prymnesium parvum TaxID=97485 RepID=A0AB34J6P8_PRYPA
MPQRMLRLCTALALLQRSEGLAPLSGYLRPRPVVMQDRNDSPSYNQDISVEQVEDVMDADSDSDFESPATFDVRMLAGISSPLNFFDPLDFSASASEGKVRFYREVELKHGRVAMLAALGFLVAEYFHPLFGGEIDVPSYIAFQETPLQVFWPAVILFIAVPEIFSVFTFQSPFGGELWAIRSDHIPGDLGFDPLGLKPKNAADLKIMETKELNNGRLAMLGVAGMVAQELATGDKLF